MKQKYLFIFLTLLSAVFACEQLDESKLGGDTSVESEKVQMTFSAVIEKDEETKTVLGEEIIADGKRVKKLLWQPKDKIGVTDTKTYTWRDEWYGNWNEYTVSKFIAKISEPSATAEFDGAAALGDTYKAFYPYSETLRDSSGYFIFNLPLVQKYVEGSFDPDAAPMVATAAYGETFEFRNLCGIVAFKLTGNSAVKSIMFSGTDGNGVSVPVSGLFDVDPASNDLTIRQHSTFGYVHSSVSVDCVEPVQLNENEPTTFYMMLPPATYADFSLVITTDDGIMLKTGRNLTITRSHIKPTGELEYAESVYVDLSAHGTANSYIVPEAGLYSFKADVVGNGVYGYVQGEKFYPSTPDISPYSVTLLWEEKPGTIKNLDLKDEKVVFMATGQKGNAFVAVKDDQENILWSWHIWVTDQPQEQVYQNDRGTFEVLDRNIGAIGASRGTNESDLNASKGLLFQWGRKDPFRSSLTPTPVNTQLYLEEVVMMPELFIAGNWNWVKDTDRSQYFWSPDQKTIYDPCPAGYRVAVNDIWYGFTKDGANADRKVKINAYGSFDYGWNFYIDETKTNTAWYPVTNRLEYWGSLSIYSDQGYMWSANSSSDGYAYYLPFHYTSDLDCSVNNIATVTDKVYGFPVRCMKDDGHETTKAPQVEFTGTTEVTTSSVTLNGKVTSEGWSAVTDRGFVWGTASDLSDGQEVSCGAGAGDFSHTLDGLEVGSVYYVKAYAVNGEGTSYSVINRISTSNSDSAENLSASGTANCYMVRPVAGTYSFDARVKGNSTESLSPVSAELIWEVDGNRNVSDNIVDNARLSYGWILFELPSDVQPGNALIAAKDADGKIVWSWHIWVADFDPVATQHLYNNGAVFMDRNLGAVVSVPDFNDLEGTWASAYGTIYQWGRKDPLVKGLLTSDRYSAFDSIEEANANPTTFAANIPWVSPSVPDLWRPEKTMYDPCPVGWKVPSYEEINGMWYYGEFSSYGLKMSVNNSQISWFGFGDYIHSDGYYYSNMGEVCYWTTNYQPSWNNVRTLYLYDGQGSWDKTPTDAYPIRCMKDK